MDEVKIGNFTAAFRDGSGSYRQPVIRTGFGFQTELRSVRGIIPDSMRTRIPHGHALTLPMSHQ